MRERKFFPNINFDFLTNEKMNINKKKSKSNLKTKNICEISHSVSH